MQRTHSTVDSGMRIPGGREGVSRRYKGVVNGLHCQDGEVREAALLHLEDQHHC